MKTKTKIKRIIGFTIIILFLSAIPFSMVAIPYENLLYGLYAVLGVYSIVGLVFLTIWLLTSN